MEGCELNCPEDGHSAGNVVLPTEFVARWVGCLQQQLNDVGKNHRVDIGVKLEEKLKQEKAVGGEWNKYRICLFAHQRAVRYSDPVFSNVKQLFLEFGQATIAYDPEGGGVDFLPPPADKCDSAKNMAGSIIAGSAQNGQMAPQQQQPQQQFLWVIVKEGESASSKKIVLDSDLQGVQCDARKACQDAIWKRILGGQILLNYRAVEGMELTGKDIGFSSDSNGKTPLPDENFKTPTFNPIYVKFLKSIWLPLKFHWIDGVPSAAMEIIFPDDCTNRRLLDACRKAAFNVYS